MRLVFELLLLRKQRLELWQAAEGFEVVVFLEMSEVVPAGGEGFFQGVEGERLGRLSIRRLGERSPMLTHFEVALLRFNPEGFQQLAGG